MKKSQYIHIFTVMSMQVLYTFIHRYICYASPEIVKIKILSTKTNHH